MISIAIKYTVFAAIATMVNIGTQYLSLSIYNKEFNLYVAMILGTLTGLIVKYIFDKKYIFYFEVKTKIEDTFKFFLYSVMGIFTTLIFWGFELTFNALFHFDRAKYIGALIGLAIGYITKYNLDKRLVFNTDIR